QAEDGIRDDLVTGVQTCALPIYGQRKKKHTPGRGHQRKSLPGKKARFARKAARERERKEKIDQKFAEWWESLTEELRKRLRPKEIGRASCREHEERSEGAERIHI